MEYKCFAVKKGMKDTPIPLIETRGGILKKYFSATINNVHKFHKWTTSAKKLCRNIGIDCDTLILKAIKNYKEVGRYQIQHIHVNTCDENRLMVTIETQDVIANKKDETDGKLFVLIFFNVTKKKDGEVKRISKPSTPIFSVSPLMTDHLLS